MKAMILAAGLGTRLRPATLHTPKPLFPIGGVPLIDRSIAMLAAAGVEAIMVNTHHLHHQIHDHIAARDYPVPVFVTHEPEILGTGGALKNIAAWWGAAPLVVINGDVVTDIDLRRVMDIHDRRGAAATLVCVDYPPINSVCVAPDGAVLGFNACAQLADVASAKRCTFTGIQVIQPVFRDFVPKTGASSSIDAYREMVSAGLPVTAWDAGDAYWIDTGTPAHYRKASLDALLPLALDTAFGSRAGTDDIRREPMTGDGSDRRWFRLRMAKDSLVMVDHGIRDRPNGITEADACIQLGRHLCRQGVPVPRIVAACAFSGLVIMEDAGDLHLQTAVLRDLQRGAVGHAAALQRYRRIIDAWIHMATTGMNGFDDSWAWQTPAYDRRLILEKECRYFMEAFVEGVAGMHLPFNDLLPEFSALADAALANGVDGFMHRDFQSRNILVCGDAIRIIDFQGGRRGPIQYDLAALLNDPYVDLPPSLTQALLDYAVERTASALPVDPPRFRTGFHQVSICRLLQALGAFGFLWRIKGKATFSTYIPVALNRLRRLLAALETPAHPRLTGLIEALVSQYPASEGRRHDTGRTP